MSERWIGPRTKRWDEPLPDLVPGVHFTPARDDLLETYAPEKAEDYKELRDVRVKVLASDLEAKRHDPAAVEEVVRDFERRVAADEATDLGPWRGLRTTLVWDKDGALEAVTVHCPASWAWYVRWVRKGGERHYHPPALAGGF